MSVEQSNKRKRERSKSGVYSIDLSKEVSYIGGEQLRQPMEQKKEPYFYVYKERKSA